MNWIDPNEQLPPQGKKILAFDAGDIYVVQRFADMWAPIPFMDSEYTTLEQPELWCDIKAPGKFTGRLLFIVDDKTLTVDDYEKECPEGYNEMIKDLRREWKNDNL